MINDALDQGTKKIIRESVTFCFHLWMWDTIYDNILMDGWVAGRDNDGEIAIGYPTAWGNFK